MPKGPLTAKNDIIFTGFLANSGGSSIDEFGESESDLDLNWNGEYQNPLICLAMITTVYQTDSRIFTTAEENVLVSFLDLSVDAQHLFIYLALHPKWHRLEHLKSVDIPGGDLLRAIAELCRPIAENSAAADSKAEVKPIVKSESLDVRLNIEPETLDMLAPANLKTEVKSEPLPGSLTRSIDANSQLTPSQSSDAAGSSTLFPRPQPNPPSLCIPDSELTLRQLLECMDPKEQNKIRDQLKIKPGKKKMDLIDSILATSSSQRSMTDFFGKGKGKAGIEKPTSQEGRLREMIMLVLQKLVRINEEVHGILLRVHIAYFRCTQLPTEILPRSLRHLLRTYPPYDFARADDVWVNREMFLEYMDGLRAEATIDGDLLSCVQLPQRTARDPKTKRKRKRPDPAKEEERRRKRAETNWQATTVKSLLRDKIFPRWAKHSTLRKLLSDHVCPGLERLEPSHALTRAVHKGVKAHQILEEPDDELIILDALLDQSALCRGLRGPWHIRKTNILAKKDGAGKDALSATQAALMDTDTRLIYRQLLITTLAKLQQDLEVETPVDIPESAKVMKVVLQVTPVETPEKKKASQWTRNDGDVGTIEELVSQYYGFEFERVAAGGSLLTTLFTLLFWDIIFMPILGAFETNFQTCPLDMCEDTFFSARRDAIELRLSKIEGGDGVNFLKLHNDQHRESKVTAVGVRWDLCSRKDLIEMVKCISPKTLANICHMFCENYVEACRGAPDFLVWNAEEKKYKLVHIQGPGYPSRESQKTWREVLARAQEENQEICKLVKPKKKGKDKKGAGSDSESGSEEPEFEEDSVRPVASGSGNSDEEDEYQPKKKKRKINRE
ncbi:hypothetical protein K438DRAFT_1963973 [Mycena galopus ATCC 62051]|nr:hypothetical protein K438DRAFT_1963973 [Mycena galopus ATCC 62051]